VDGFRSAARRGRPPRAPRHAEGPPLSWRHPLRTDDAGLVRFEKLDPGLYHVTATQGESRAEADVTVGGGVVTPARLDLRQP
jgi:hypothetical protein